MLLTNCQQKWGPPLADVFPRVVYEEEHKLPNAIKEAGYDIKDVKAIIMGHLHLDHAGGLEHFMGTDVPSSSALPSLPSTNRRLGTDPEQSTCTKPNSSMRAGASLQAPTWEST